MDRRTWLDWNEPALPAAVLRLMELAGRGGAEPTPFCDLRHVFCVLPGQRAGRLLLALLAQRCENEGRALIPPGIGTPGDIVDALVDLRRRPAASAHEQELAWTRALSAADPQTIAPLVPNRPADEEVLDWYHLARHVRAIADELSGENRTPTNVAEQAERFELFGEADRWRALENVHRAYAAQLAGAGLVDPDAARWEALASGAHARLDRQLVLIGVVELNAMQRAAVAAWGDRVTVLVHAPEALADRFDELGCLRPDAWADFRLDLDDEQIVVADRPADQAQAVLRALAGFGAAHRPEEIAVGLGEPDLHGRVVRAGRSAGVTLHWAAGRALSRTAPFHLLAAARAWLDEGRLSALGALLRHPHVEARLITGPPAVAGAEEACPALLDDYVARHIQDDGRGKWLGRPDHRKRLDALRSAVTTVLAPLLEPGDRALGEWATRIVDALHAVYAPIGDDPDVAGNTLLAEACGRINETCAECARAAPELQPRLDAATAIAIVLARAERETVPLPPRRGEIEMLGWLELRLDPAPAVVVAGFNEGRIPETVTGDAFLPDALRRSLGLTCNARRYARDAYALEALRHGCRDVRLVAGHRNADGDALAPSRLLLATNRERLPGRVLRLCGETAAYSARWPAGVPAAGAATAFTVPALPDDLPLPDHMSVTDFSAYLACPYRYALQKLLRLEPVHPHVVEMEPMTFGGLAHDVLHAFAADAAVADSTDADRIADFLVRTMRALAAERFGPNPLPAVRVQLARLERRLTAFAAFQAGERDKGWVIRDAEIKYENTPLDVPDQDPMPLTGRVDRIDQHEGTGAWRIIDYKTSDNAKSPHAAHHGVERLKGELEWKDLQLPLYRYLAQRHGVGDDLTLGYIALPNRPDGVDFLGAEWSNEQVDGAVEKAREVVRRIRERRFEINPEYDNPYDDFARICQTNVFGAEAPREEEP